MTLAKITFIFLLVITQLFCASCESKKPEEFKHVPKSLGVSFDPFISLSNALGNSMGFQLEKSGDSILIKEVAEFGIAAQAGLENGMEVQSIDGLSIPDILAMNLDKLTEMIKIEKKTVEIKDKDGSVKAFPLELSRDNAPQKKSDDFIFVSKPDGLKAPTVFLLHSEREIKQLTFKRETLTWVDFFDPVSNQWLIAERIVDTFPVKMSIDSFSAVLPSTISILPDKMDFLDDRVSADISIREPINMNITAGYFIRADTDKINASDKIHVSMSTLSAASSDIVAIESDGYMLIKHTSDYFLSIYSDSYSKPVKNSLPESSPSVTEKLLDWIILLKPDGSTIELTIDGVGKIWHGTIFNNVENVYQNFQQLRSLEFSWLESYLPGLEDSPYPDELTLKFPDDFEGVVRLFSYSPQFTDNNHRMLIPLAGTMEIPGEEPVPIAGCMRRMMFP